MSTLSKFLRSLRHARHGLYQAIAHENSFRIHLAVAVVLILILVGLKVKPIEAAMIIFLISTILTLELVNTVVERFVDLLEPRVHTYVGLIKDLLAAGILITAVAASIIGILILGPYVLAAIRSL
jgi:diacylglycerol kinase